MRVCNQAGCDVKAICRGVCSKHYERLLNMGGPRGRVTQCAACGHVFWSPSQRRLFCGDFCEKAVKPYYNRDWAERNRERYSSYHAQYREDNRETLRKNAKAYNNRTRVVRREYMRMYRQSNPDYARQWRKTHPDLILRRAAIHRIKHQELKADVFPVRVKFLLRTLERYRWACAYCRAPLPERFHWDHVIPLSRGGVHGESNLLPACPPCNLSKSDSTVAEWRKRRPL